MIKDGVGGANTKTGLVFEGKTSLEAFISQQPGYAVVVNKSLKEVHFKNALVAYLLQKNALYRFLASKGVVWSEHISKKLLPDECIYVLSTNTMFVVECKYQQVAGSVDEKLQTCDFKKRQYRKLLSPLNIDIEYIYLLGEWFKAPGYKDVLDYIKDVGCHYYFESVPLTMFGLPSES